MKTKLRIFAAVLCVAFLFGFVAACGDSSTPPADPPAEQPADPPPADPPADPPAEQPADEPAEAPDDRIVITFSIWGDDAERETTQAALDVYNGLQDKVYVEVISIPNETYGPELQTRLAGGNMPDCGMVLENTVLSWAREGLLQPLDIFAGQSDSVLDYLVFKDGGQPVATSTANEILALWYDRDMFDAAGVDYPPATLDEAWTWDEFVEVAKQLTFDANGNTPNDAGFDKDNIVQYGAYVNQWTWQLEVWALSNGGSWYATDGNSLVFDEKAIEGMQKVLDLHLVHNVAPFNPAQSDNGFGDSLGAGNVAMCTEGQWAVGFDRPGTGVGVLPYMERKVTIATAGCVGVFAGTQHPDEVADFLRWYANPDNNMGPIVDGWWMPNLRSWYTDESLLTKWIDDVPLRQQLDAANYRTAFVDVALDTSVTQSTGWYYTPNTDQIINGILNGAMVEAINGTKTVAQVIEEVRPQMEAAING